MNHLEIRVELFATLGCHLCEEAEHLLLALDSDELNIEIIPVEIADNPDLMERYGVRIPVVRVSGRELSAPGTTNQELGWPFNLETLRTFLLADRV